MKMNLSVAGTIARIVFNESGKIVGFGAIKMATGNELIMSPLYAETLDAATALMSTLLKGIPAILSFSSLITIYPDVNNDVPR